jgi:hypothetical protein
MKCSFCGGAVSWVGNLIDNPSTQCADCGRRNCQEVEPGPYDDDWAPNPNDDQGQPLGVLGTFNEQPKGGA